MHSPRLDLSCQYAEQFVRGSGAQPTRANSRIGRSGHSEGVFEYGAIDDGVFLLCSDSSSCHFTQGRDGRVSGVQEKTFLGPQTARC